ncbi:hypothetical protein GE061_002085 [Apolygus lucorum]|uniref:Uncharacterized protein n=1 Tax=Apolygus lucorum TaxID=248454 RepID=A0A8S9X3N4_APOLU|nr:hypothetical protein GE061_002085 [Apolygus lucorum]
MHFTALETTPASPYEKSRINMVKSHEATLKKHIENPSPRKMRSMIRGCSTGYGMCSSLDVTETTAMNRFPASATPFQGGSHLRISLYRPCAG